MSVGAAALRVEHLPKKLPIAIFTFNNWYTGRVKNSFGNKVHVCFDRMDDSTRCGVPTEDMTVDRCVVVETSALTFPCPYPDCDKSHAGNHFQDKSRWQQHIRMHNGTAPKCPFCRAMDANLRRHIRRHGKEGPVRPLILATDSEIAKMKIGVLRATLEAAGVPFKDLKGERQLRQRLRGHKEQYKGHVIAAMLGVIGEISPQYSQQQQQMETYVNRELSDDRNTIGLVMLNILRQTGAIQTHAHLLDEKKLLKRLKARMLAMLPAVPDKPKRGYFKAIPADTTGDGVADGFKIDTNNDGSPDTFVRVVNPPKGMTGRWGNRVKKRRLGTMKEDQLDVSAVLNEKDREIAQLRQQLMSLQVPSPRPSPLDVINALPPRVILSPLLPQPPRCLEPSRIGACPPELEPHTPAPVESTGKPSGGSSPPTHASQCPPSPRWQLLKNHEMYDMNLIAMLKCLGFADVKYWGHVTGAMVLKWERETGIALKPGVKIKFLDVYGKKWSDGQTVEVLHKTLWQTGEVMQTMNGSVTVMCKTSLTPAEIVTVPRREVSQRMREPTMVTKMKRQYEREIERLKNMLGESGDSTSSGTDSDDRSSPFAAIVDDSMVKEEPIDEEFDWHSLKDIKEHKRLGFSSSSPRDSPWGGDGAWGCMPSINTEAPWDSVDCHIDDGSTQVGSMMQQVGSYLHAGTPMALRGVLPLIPKFRHPVRPPVVGLPSTMMEIPEPSSALDFAG